MDDLDQLSQLASDKKAAAEIAQRVKSSIHELNSEIEDYKTQLKGLISSLQNLIGESSSDAEASDQLAEHQRACDQYTYRDRLLVQEFYFAIVVVGLGANFVHKDFFSLTSAVVAGMTGILLAMLWLHLKHLRADRDLMWARARSLEEHLKMRVMRRIWDDGYDASTGKKRMLSGTGLMVKAVGLVSLVSLALSVVILHGVSDNVAATWEHTLDWLQGFCTPD